MTVSDKNKKHEIASYAYSYDHAGNKYIVKPVVKAVNKAKVWVNTKLTAAKQWGSNLWNSAKKVASNIYNGAMNFFSGGSSRQMVYGPPNPNGTGECYSYTPVANGSPNSNGFLSHALLEARIAANRQLGIQRQYAKATGQKGLP